jgi:hypothetical protein
MQVRFRTHLHVKVVVEVLVDLLRVAVLLQQTAQDTQAPDPHDLLGQARLAGTAAFTYRHRERRGLGTPSWVTLPAGLTPSQLSNSTNVPHGRTTKDRPALTTHRY